MAYKVIRYHCDFCKKVFANKTYCEKEHEPICFFNPQRKSCGTCARYIGHSIYDDHKCSAGIDISRKQKVECYSYIQDEYLNKD